MRPRTDKRAVTVLRNEIPQFEPYLLDLREVYGEDLTTEVVFNEFADYVQTLIDDDEDVELIERCFGALETVLTADWDEGWPLVGYSFLDALHPATLESAIEYLGPATGVLLRRLATLCWDCRDAPLSPDDLAEIGPSAALGYLGS
jgi:hypothetical protein